MPAPSFARMMVKFCQRATTALSPRDAERFQAWILDLVAARMPPPRVGREYDWQELADACGIDAIELKRARRVIAPGLDALVREVIRDESASQFLRQHIFAAAT